eukprot:TRINITY_DN14301_c0_g1_i1.p1 TRINITY_DN14301_c0_g1~~TRINITY_DN14301_c0_g1_i1.p1  ORF type:complete len:279 (-),score=66.33 TRINITY_DN14301_c0_g1_i1:575-1411(-)
MARLLTQRLARPMAALASRSIATVRAASAVETPFLERDITADKYKQAVEEFSKPYVPLLRGKHALNEPYSKHKSVLSYEKEFPIVRPDNFVAPNALVAGRVKFGKDVSIWYGSVVRGDVEDVEIGVCTNIQDGSVVTNDTEYDGHKYEKGENGPTFTTYIGDFVTVGHRCVLKSCRIYKESLIGMGSIVLGGAVIEKRSMVAAGSVVARYTRIPSGQLWGGSPARYMRDLTEDELAFLKKSAQHYWELAETHKEEFYMPYSQGYLELEKMAASKSESH